jgi:hypothetical protein
MILENRDAELRFYGADGTYLRTIGRRGEGPGEFRWVDWARQIHGDSILVWAGRLRRASVFTSAGEFGRQANPAIPEGIDLLIARGAFPDGHLLVLPHTQPDHILGSMVRDTAAFAVWDPTAPETLDTITRIPVAGTYIDENANLWPVAFTPSAEIAMAPTGLASSGGADLAFDLHARDGRQLLRVHVDQPARAISPAELAQYRQEQVDAADPAARADLERRFDELPFRSHYPALDGILFDSEGAIWIRLYNPDESAPQSWHVFDQDGAQLAFVQTPAGLSISDIRENEILGRWRVQLGVPTVRVYTLDRQPQPPPEA